MDSDTQQEEIIKKTHTSCRDCVFASYDTFAHQTGCQLNRIEKWRTQSPDSVVDTYDFRDVDGVSVTKNFFVINGKLCNTHRNVNSRWAGEYQGEAAKIRVMEECKLKVAMLVYLGEGLTVDELRKTTEGIKGQILLPFQVFFVNNQAEIPPGKINAIAMEVLGNDTTWRINTILQRNDDESRVSRECSLDYVANSLSNPATTRKPCATYYAVVNAGFVLPPDFLASLDHAVNVELDPFRLLSPLPDGNCLVVQVFFHLHPKVGGWDTWYPEEGGEPISDIVEKMKILAEEHGAPHILVPVELICPSLFKVVV